MHLLPKRLFIILWHVFFPLMRSCFHFLLVRLLVQAMSCIFHGDQPKNLWLFGKSFKCFVRFSNASTNMFMNRGNTQFPAIIWSHLLKISLMEKFIFCAARGFLFFLIFLIMLSIHREMVWRFQGTLTSNISFIWENVFIYLTYFIQVY